MEAIVALFHSVLIVTKSFSNWRPEGVNKAKFELIFRDSISLHARCERFYGSKVRRDVCYSAMVAASERLTGRVVEDEDDLPLWSLVLTYPSCSVELCNPSKLRADVALARCGLVIGYVLKLTGSQKGNFCCWKPTSWLLTLAEDFAMSLSQASLQRLHDCFSHVDPFLDTPIPTMHILKQLQMLSERHHGIGPTNPHCINYALRREIKIGYSITDKQRHDVLLRPAKVEPLIANASVSYLPKRPWDQSDDRRSSDPFLP